MVFVADPVKISVLDTSHQKKEEKRIRPQKQTRTPEPIKNSFAHIYENFGVNSQHFVPIRNTKWIIPTKGINFC